MNIMGRIIYGYLLKFWKSYYLHICLILMNIQYKLALATHLLNLFDLYKYLFYKISIQNYFKSDEDYDNNLLVF